MLPKLIYDRRRGGLFFSSYGILVGIMAARRRPRRRGRAPLFNTVPAYDVTR